MNIWTSGLDIEQSIKYIATSESDNGREHVILITSS